jgi:hypothetical protein
LPAFLAHSARGQKRRAVDVGFRTTSAGR